MVYKYYPIEGIKEGLGPGDQVPIRREVNEWSMSKDPIDQMQVNLFLLALRRFQAVSPDSRDSYFQIAGETRPTMIIIGNLQRHLIATQVFMACHTHPGTSPALLLRKPIERVTACMPIVYFHSGIGRICCSTRYIYTFSV